MKRAEVFDLKNSKIFNITGEFHLRSTITGQDYKIVAIHPNRTVVFTSDYDFQERTTKTNSKLQLAQDIWISYNLMVENKTQVCLKARKQLFVYIDVYRLNIDNNQEIRFTKFSKFYKMKRFLFLISQHYLLNLFCQGNNESQSFSVELAYPKRNLSTEGWYAITENTFDSDLSFKWTEDPKPASGGPNDDYNYDSNDDDGSQHPREVRAVLNWRNEPLQGIDKVNQSVSLIIRHPSFEKDVTLKARYYRSLVDLLRAKFEADYCDDPDHFVNFEALAQDLTSEVGYRNYSVKVVGLHIASEVILNANGSVGARPGLYEAQSLGEYKRGYLPLQDGSLVAALNLRTKEIRYLVSLALSVRYLRFY